MDSINLMPVIPVFVTALFGTAAACIALGVWALANWHDSYSPYLLAGAAVYLVGVVVVTGALHVPRNDALAKLEPTSEESPAYWNHYLSGGPRGTTCGCSRHDCSGTTDGCAPCWLSAQQLRYPARGERRANPLGALSTWTASRGHNTIAIVTGANQGLGSALAEGLAQRLEAGDVVFLTGRDPERARAAAGRVSSPGAEVRGRVVDVRDPVGVAAFAGEVHASHASDSPAEVVAGYVDTSNLGTTRVVPWRMGTSARIDVNPR